MKFINKSNHQLFLVTDRRTFYDTECPVEGAQLDRLAEIVADFEVVNQYLMDCYMLLRQGAKTEQLEVPACLGKEGPSQEQPEPQPEPPVSAASSNEATGNSSPTVELSTTTNPGE